MVPPTETVLLLLMLDILHWCVLLVFLGVIPFSERRGKNACSKPSLPPGVQVIWFFVDRTVP